MTITEQWVSNTSKDNYPVFRGLEDIRVSGKDIAKILGVSAPTYSKWRSGQGHIPAAKLVMLTLLLANWIDEMEAELELRTRISRDPQSEIALKALRRCLALQEDANNLLTQDEVRDGSRLFRKWWLAKMDGPPDTSTKQAVA